MLRRALLVTLLFSIPALAKELKGVKMADTVEGLAALIKVDPAVLKGTVDRWNGFVDKGKDEDFDRGQRAYGD